MFIELDDEENSIEYFNELKDKIPSSINE